MSNADVEAFLEHYGILGMKWGVRKDPESGRPPSEKARRKFLSKKPDVKRAIKNTVGVSAAIGLGYLILKGKGKGWTKKTLISSFNKLKTRPTKVQLKERAAIGGAFTASILGALGTAKIRDLYKERQNLDSG